MDYDKRDLYKLNINQLREVGKSVNLKGVTNKSKEELVEALSRRNGGEQMVDQDLALLRRLNTKEAMANEMKGTYGGYVLIDESDILCKMFDENFLPLGISVPITAVKSAGVVDGDFLHAKVSISDGIKFVSTVLDINRGFLTHSNNEHTRELCLVTNVFEYTLERQKQDKSSDITQYFVLPLATTDETQRLENIKIECMTYTIFGFDEPGYLMTRLAMSKLRSIAQMGNKILAYCDLDRMLMSLQTRLEYNQAIMRLRRIFSGSYEYSNGGALMIVGLTNSQKLFDELKSFCTKEIKLI